MAAQTQSGVPARSKCPRCRVTLSIAARKAGSVIDCPKCCQPVIVPTPPPAEPLPGILVSHGPDEPAGAAPDVKGRVWTVSFSRAAPAR